MKAKDSVMNMAAVFAETAVSCGFSDGDCDACVEFKRRLAAAFITGAKAMACLSGMKPDDEVPAVDVLPLLDGWAPPKGGISC